MRAKNHGSKDEEADWTEVRSCGSLQEAEVARSVLDGAGIRVVIPDQYTLGIYGGLPVVGPVRVLVRRADLRRAAELLTTDSTRSKPRTRRS